MTKEITMDINPNFDFIIEEGANTSTNLRMISWNGREEKLDLRKWTYEDGGTERPGKGVTLSQEGADELAAVLVEQGYGDGSRLMAALSKREDYENFNNSQDISEDSEDYFYDPSELLAGKVS